jgi:DNA replication ATP-dependent helicase Dna2
MNKIDLQEFCKNGLEDVLKIHAQESFDAVQKSRSLYALLQSSLDILLNDEGQAFTSLFAKLSYAGTRFRIAPGSMFIIHRFRKSIDEIVDTEKSKEIYALAIKALILWFDAFSDCPIPDDLSDLADTYNFTEDQHLPQKGFVGTRSVLLTDYDEQLNCLMALDLNEEGQTRQVNLSEMHEGVLSSKDLLILKKYSLLPLKANLLEVTIDEDNRYHPKIIILEPDYLVDVTAIAGCFSAYQSFPILYVLKKFQEVRKNKYLLLGNLANQMLDMLIEDPNMDFQAFIPHIFPMDAIGFALFDNQTIKEILASALHHFEAIKHVVNEDFVNQHIDRRHVMLEPSFFAPEYGLQGRLDLLYINEENRAANIIELKSGKAFQANSYGLGQSHYVQTLLYDLMLKSVFKNKLKPTNFILYSGEVKPYLRFAPPVKAQQIEALAVRNKVMISERFLTSGNPVLTEQIINGLQADKYPDLKGFVQSDLRDFHTYWEKLDPLEKQYFLRFVSFIANEQYFSKLGEQSIDKRNGLADMWLNTLGEKLEQLVILNHVEIKENKTMEDPPTMTLSFTGQTNVLSNFRVGDIIVMYPAIGISGESVLRHQIFKASIISMDQHSVVIRFRAKQMNQKVFKTATSWHLEHDNLDSGFNRQFESMFHFMRTTDSYRKLFLGRRMPAKAESQSLEPIEGLTEEQQEIFEKIVASREYFLLWGPPGTGKTSVMLKHLIHYLVMHKNERILLLAYTNRAVDEICRAIESLGDGFEDQYIRVGSRYSCEGSFQHALFDTKVKDIRDRGTLRKTIKSHPIYVATLASFSSRKSLLDIITFDRILIDEASQILEPGLAGLLCYFPKWVLIGDHRQLPAVVAQPESMSAVEDEKLQELGIVNCRDSLFERLFIHCQMHGWDHAYGSLHFQGRMHPRIMEFASEQFYNRRLNALEKISRFDQEEVFGLDQYPWNQRMIFIPSQIDLDAGFSKTNSFEVAQIIHVLQSLKTLHGQGGYFWDPSEIGIISPFRAQIAAIKTALEKQMPDVLGSINIDTVERYQGGARDIIIISLCVNRADQLTRLAALSREGIDRKLNVAVTRAREQLVIIGNKAILSQNPIYKELMLLSEEYSVVENQI